MTKLCGKKTARQCVFMALRSITTLDVTKNTKLRGYSIGNMVFASLDCGGNLLTTLDVSQNADLRVLICPGNQLAELDVSGNIFLEELFCGHNLLTELDVTNNTGLVHLGCSGNSLAGLDVSKNTDLVFLGCMQNQFVSLNLSANTDLTYVNCRENLLTELDVSSNAALEGLDCAENQLTRLDVSNAKLSSTMGYANFSGWENYSPGLVCSGNQLTGLDLSQNPDIVLLNCANNLLTGLDVSNNTMMWELNCAGNYMESPDDVIGWREIGLALDASFLYYPQRMRPGDDITDKFIDPAFLAAVRELLGKGADEPIFEGDVGMLTDLPVQGLDIYDLAGIEYFISLRGLWCSNNRLETLDLSNNSMLEILYCGANQLSSLDISRNTELRELFCGSNELTELEVSENAKLEILYCEWNNLTVVDVSNNGALIALDTAGNPLNALDISQNTGLTILSCGQNQLTALDVSRNTELTELYCWDNRLSDIDLSNNVKLERLNCGGNQINRLDVSRNTELRELICGDNQLSSLDVSDNAVLEYLWCGGNYLTALDLSNNPDLLSLYCHDNPLDALDVSRNTELTELFCWNNRLSDIDLSNNVKLERLNCGGNQINRLDVSRNTELRELICWGNQLSSLDVSNNVVLEYLWCGGNYLTALDLSNNPGLLSLYCHDNLLDALDTSRNAKLIQLICWGNRLSALDISNNEKLEWLECGRNNLKELDLEKNTALLRLECYGNQLEGLDITSTSLEMLNCTYNLFSTPDDVTGWELKGLVMDESFYFYPQRVPAETYAVTVVAGAAGGGYYEEGETVRISAGTPPTGWQFSHWTADPDVDFDDAHSARAAFTMPANAVTVTAVFEPVLPLTYAVTVNGGAGATGGGYYEEGATVTVSAGSPPAGWQFSHWTADPDVDFDDAHSARAAFTMPANAVTVTAVFEPVLPLTYAVTVNGGAGAAGGGYYEEGATVTVSAGSPPAGWQFSHWTANPAVDFDDVYSARATFTMPANAVTVTAVFEPVLPLTYAVTVNGGAGAAGGGYYEEGETVRISAGSPPAGWQFSHWTANPAVDFDDAHSASAAFTMPANAVTVTAVFAPILPTTYAISVTAGTGGRITGGESGNYSSGTVISISAAANPGYRFLNWTSSNGGTFAGADKSATTFTTPANDTVITANFIYEGGGGYSGDGYTPVYPSVSKPSASGPSATIPAGQTPLGGGLAELYAKELYKLGLFVGTGKDAKGEPLFSLDQPLTRIQALALVIRLLGQEEAAMAFDGANPFTDVPEWGAKYAAFAYAKGIAAGVNDEHTLYASDRPVSLQEFSAFLLRALGYFEINGDFAFQDAINKAILAGIYSASEAAELGNGKFLRKDAVAVMVGTLLANVKGSGNTLLLDGLAKRGVFTEDEAKAFAQAIEAVRK